MAEGGTASAAGAPAEAAEAEAVESGVTIIGAVRVRVRVCWCLLLAQSSWGRRGEERRGGIPSPNRSS
jgi:hypothetical protein